MHIFYFMSHNSRQTELLLGFCQRRYWSAAQMLGTLALLTGVLNVHRSSSICLKQNLLNGFGKKKRKRKENLRFLMRLYTNSQVDGSRNFPRSGKSTMKRHFIWFRTVSVRARISTKTSLLWDTQNFLQGCLQNIEVDESRILPRTMGKNLKRITIL